MTTKEQPWKAHLQNRKPIVGGSSHGTPAGQLLYEAGDTVSKPRERMNEQAQSSATTGQSTNATHTDASPTNATQSKDLDASEQYL